MGGVFALIMLPFMLLMTFLAPVDESGVAGSFFAILMIIVYPIMACIMGWISGLLMSVVYNIVTRWTGGLVLEFASTAPVSSELPPA